MVTDDGLGAFIFIMLLLVITFVVVWFKEKPNSVKEFIKTVFE